MLVRVVKMGIEPKLKPLFIAAFKDNKKAIRSFPGCLHLELLEDKNNPSIVFTYSHWENEIALENYRTSPLFNSVWSKVKPLFNIKPEAWSFSRTVI
ncbi:MAG: putative quinol monooxygenase [Flavobacteriales bacterium]